MHIDAIVDFPISAKGWRGSAPARYASPHDMLSKF